MVETANMRVRNLRCDDDLWDRAMARAASEGVPLSEVIRGWLDNYARGDNAAPLVRLTDQETRAVIERVAEFLAGMAGSVPTVVVTAVNAARQSG